MRLVHITRESDHFRLAFPYAPDLVDAVRELPYASFDPDTKSWTSLVCRESVDALRDWYYQGKCDVAVDDLVAEDELLDTCPLAVLTPGSARRPFVARTARRDDGLFDALRSIPGSSWDKKSRALTYPPTAAAALAELVAAGKLSDPDGLLSPAATTVTFDAREGKFKVLGDPRAQAAFDQNFPRRDVIAAWKSKELDVAFSDPFSEEVYQGELARGDDSFEVPGLQVDLFDYQKKSVAFATARSGSGVWHAPGLGKTAIGVAWGFEMVENRKSAARTVVFCPGAVRGQWRDEIVRFTGCDVGDVVVVDGAAKVRKRLYEEAAQARWVVVHYDVLSRDYDLIVPFMKNSVVVADEAHRLKSPDAKRTQAARKLAKHTVARLALSGTPVESVPDEWLHVMSFAVPGCLGGTHDFLNRYMYRNRFNGYEGARNLKELRERSNPHYIRFTKDQVATHLPPLRVQHYPLDPDPSYAAALRRAHREARDEIAAERRDRALRTGKVGVLDGDVLDELEAGAEMTAVGMLRLLCTSPRLVAQSDAPAAQALRDAGVVPDVDGPKLDEVRRMAAEMQRTGDRVVVFTFSRRMADLVAERFEEDGTRYVLYTGDTPEAAREEARKRFIDPEDDVTVFLATDAASEGLNLGRCCSTLVNLDIPWTPTRLEQRSNRIHRIDGTAPKYLVINMTLRGTLEEGILRMVEAKADLADGIFGESGGRERTTGRKRKWHVDIDALLSESTI